MLMCAVEVAEKRLPQRWLWGSSGHHGLAATAVHPLPLVDGGELL